MSITAALDAARACVRGAKDTKTDPSRVLWVVTTTDPKTNETTVSRPMAHSDMVQYKSAMQAAFAATRLGLPMAQMEAALRRALPMRDETRLRLEALIRYYNLNAEVPTRTKLRFGGRR